ncbi:MAG: glycosyltransferase family 39 protein [Xanthobacteraceae bacterium]|nr:glycosyltransferase family 39 protein [Xanthobacteraceae bacterium]
MRLNTMTQRVKNAAPADWLAFAAIVALSVIAGLTFRDYGLGWDDYAHSHYGELLYSYYATGGADKRAFEFYNLFYYGGGFDLAASILDRFMPTDLFESRRLMGAIVGILGLIVVWRLARRVGGPVAGVAAVVLLAITPLYYGHMFINAKDTPFAVAMAFLLYAFVRAFDEYPKPKPLTLALFALALGLLIGTRVIGGIAVFFVGAALFVYVLAESKESGFKPAALRAAKFAGLLALMLPFAYAVMAVVWPYAVQSPLNPFKAIGYFSNFWEKPWKETFDGVQILIPDMPRTYLPKLCLLKIPEIVGGLAIAGIAGSMVAIFRGIGTPSKRASLALLAAAALVPILLVVITRPVLYNGIRHFLFVVPPMAVLAGVAVAYIFEKLQDYRRWAPAAGMAVFAFFVGITVVDMIRIHPYQYALFNHVAGGVRGAADRYMLDYWALGFKEASETLLEKIKDQKLVKPANRKWKVAVCGPPAVVALELGDDFEATNEAKGADFAVSLGTFYCAELFAPIMYEVRRDTVVFARVYDVRRLSFSTTYNSTPEDRPAAQVNSAIHTFWQ